MDLDDLLGRYPNLLGMVGIDTDTSGGGGGSDDNDDDDDDTSRSSGDDDDDDDDDEDEEDDATKAKKNKEARYRRQRNEARAEKRRLEERIAQLENKDNKDDLENIKKERDDLKTNVQELEEKLVGEQIRVGVIEQLGRYDLNPKRAKAIMREVLSGDHGELEIDDDGEIDGIDDVLKSVAKEYPEWVVKSKSNGEEEEEDDDKETKTRSTTSGRATNRKKKSGNELDREYLSKKFPALRR